MQTIFVCSLLFVGAIASPFLESEKFARANQRAAAPKGLKVQWIGHSFHWFLPTPIAKLAAEAGIQGHVNLGIDRIPASYPCDHWNKQNNKPWPGVLKAGKADILTIASRELGPDPCIPNFVKMANDGNKKIRVMVQETWLPVSANRPAESCSGSATAPGEKNKSIERCTNRDGATFEILEQTRQKWEAPFRDILRKQSEGLNKNIGRNVTSLVPIWDGVLALRQAVVRGQVPGITRQEQLFADGLGHAKKPLENLVSYMWFIAMYGVNPSGFKSLGEPSAQGKVLQQIAWDTVKKEPLLGIKLA